MQVDVPKWDSKPERDTTSCSSLRMWAATGRWSFLLMTLVHLFFSLEACSYPKPAELYATREITQCFTAPVLSKSYPSKMECSWKISTNHSNDLLHVTVEEVRLPSATNSKLSSCLFHHVIILDGNKIEADSLGHWCGTAKQTYITSGQEAYVYFRSQTLTIGGGFKVCYVSVKHDNEETSDLKTGASAIGMFGYVILGWIILLVALKLTWDRFKKIKGYCRHEARAVTLEPNPLDNTEPRIDLSIISVAPPPYDHIPPYPDEAPPPYLPRRHSQSDALPVSHAHSHRIIFDNFILTRAPPPSYNQCVPPEVHRNTRSGNSIDGHGRNHTESRLAIGRTSEQR